MYSLRLYHDFYETNAKHEEILNAQHSILYTREGSATINGKNVETDKAVYQQDTMDVQAGINGAEIWRWEMVRTDSAYNIAKGAGTTSILKMARRVTMFELAPKSKWLFKLDCIIKSKGTTGLHSHPGSGIRCMLEGQFKIESRIGESFYGLEPGDPWYEEGAYPLVSTPPDGVETTFLRCMILPLEYTEYPDTALWIEGKKICESDWALYSQQVITLL